MHQTQGWRFGLVVVCDGVRCQMSGAGGIGSGEWWWWWFRGGGWWPWFGDVLAGGGFDSD